MYPARRRTLTEDVINSKIDRAPWYPPSNIKGMREILLDFDSRIVGSSEFIYDVSLLKSMSKQIVERKVNDSELEHEFIKLYVKVIDGYNKYVTEYNKTVK